MGTTTRYVPTPSEVAATGVHAVEQGTRRGDPAGALAGVLADLDRQWQVPPVALAAELARQIAQALAQDPDFVRELARLVAREAVAESRRIREKEGRR